MSMLFWRNAAIFALGVATGSLIASFLASIRRDPNALEFAVRAVAAAVLACACALIANSDAIGGKP